MSFKMRNLSVNSYLQQKVLEVAKQATMHDSVTINENADIKINKDITCVMLSMTGGGGCGGYSTTKGTFVYGGGGGGSGGACMKKPIKITHTPNQETIIKIIIGRGGNSSRPDGEETIIYVYNDDKVISKYAAYGGKGAIGKLNKGGEGGIGSALIFQGTAGNNGSLTTSLTAVGVGGNGGDSMFSKGGLGGNQENLNIDANDDFTYPTNKNNPIGLKGSNGSGGGGSAPGASNQTVGDGGNGFVIVEY